jgi:hypothetical protein
VAARGAFPSLVALEDGTVLAAWETDGAIEIGIVGAVTPSSH